jgi:hypothetical protein
MSTGSWVDAEFVGTGDRRAEDRWRVRRHAAPSQPVILTETDKARAYQQRALVPALATPLPQEDSILVRSRKGEVHALAERQNNEDR